jgi:hypothetical protein
MEGFDGWARDADSLEPLTVRYFLLLFSCSTYYYETRSIYRNDDDGHYTPAPRARGFIYILPMPG